MRIHFIYSSYGIHEVCMLHVGAPWCRWLTAECSVEVRRALRCAAAAAAAGGASVHSLQCCDVRPLYLSPGCSVSPHLILFARPPRNRFIRRGDLRAGGRWKQLTLCVFGTEVSLLFIWFDCSDNRPISFFSSALFLSEFPALGGHLTVSNTRKERRKKNWSPVIVDKRSICWSAHISLFWRRFVTAFKQCNRKAHLALWAGFFPPAVLFTTRWANGPVWEIVSYLQPVVYVRRSGLLDAWLHCVDIFSYF